MVEQAGIILFYIVAILHVYAKVRVLRILACICCHAPSSKLKRQRGEEEETIYIIFI